jgi:hypothetical protein
MQIASAQLHQLGEQGLDVHSYEHRPVEAAR